MSLVSEDEDGSVGSGQSGAGAPAASAGCRGEKVEGVREGAFDAGLDAKRSCRKVGEEHTEQLQDEHTEDSILQAGQPFKHRSVTVTYSNPLNQPPFSFLLQRHRSLAHLKEN